MSYQRLSRIYGGELTPPRLPKELNINTIMSMINSMSGQDNNDMQGSFGSTSPLPLPVKKPLPGSSIRFKGGQHADPIPQTPMQQQPRLERIGQSMQQPQPVQKSPNVIINDMSPYERETINFKRDELRAKERMAGTKLNVTDENTDARTAIAAQRANIYDFKAKNPGMKFMISKGGNIIAMDPITGQPHDTGVSSGTLSERDKIAITNTGDLAEIEARGNIQKDIQGTRGAQALEQIGARVAGQKDIQGVRGEQSLAQIAARANEQRNTNAAKPIKPATDMLPTQSRVLEANKARELANTRPDLAKFLKQDDKGNYTVEPPVEAGWLGAAKPTQAQFEEINAILYPKSGAKSEVKPKVETKPKVEDKKAPTAPPGWKYVPKAGGGWTAVEDK